ncbi:hypothetical protein [Paenibacillus agricola]|uniref:hypothetical protein n=1 Tax=Paenibacillus agricola TaxID=2716264 RepID=UPI001A9DC81A|nr:hypothetical protein [Paenibacillus agricola]
MKAIKLILISTPGKSRLFAVGLETRRVVIHAAIIPESAFISYRLVRKQIIVICFNDHQFVAAAGKDQQSFDAAAEVREVFLFEG